MAADRPVAGVTGAGRGIGREIALALARAGAELVLAGRDEATLEATASAASRTTCLTVRTDVTDEGAVEALARATLERFGQVDALVANSGVGGPSGPRWELPLSSWEETFAVNVTGVFLCAQAEGRVMLEAGYGKIINTASMSASIVNTPQNQAAYNASKAGVIHLTRSLAAEWASRGVRVNSISPGYTRTQLVDDLVASPEGRRMVPQWMQLTPMGRMAEVTDLQGAVVYLSSEASDFMTGHDMVIDGGYCVW